jgi:hypothetical protein
MDWATYTRAVRGFKFSIYRTLVMTRVADDILAGWPESLPDRLKGPLAEGRREYSKLVLAFINREIPQDEFEARREQLLAEWEKVEGRRPLLGATVLMYFSNPEAASQDIDFRRIVVSQGVVMICAHIDAFLADTVRAICRTRPEVLKGSGKTMEWASIIEAGSWDRLLESLIERYVYDFGFPPIPQRIKTLAGMGLDITVEERVLKVVDEGEALRDIVVHDAGIASRKYLSRTKRSDLRVGELVAITLDEVQALGNAAVSLGEGVADATADKFYGKGRVHLW